MTNRHPAHRPVLGVICALMVASFACNLGSWRAPVETPPPAREEVPATSGEAVVLTSAMVGPEGGTITVTGSEGPLEGLEIEVPAGALASDTQWEISYHRRAAVGPV